MLVAFRLERIVHRAIPILRARHGDIGLGDGFHLDPEVLNALSGTENELSDMIEYIHLCVVFGAAIRLSHER